MEDIENKTVEQELAEAAEVYSATREEPTQDEVEHTKGFFDSVEIDEPEEEEEEPEHFTKQDVQDSLNLTAIKRPLAEVTVGLLGVVLPLAFVAFKMDREDGKFTDEETETLIQAFANYYKEKDVEATPGGMLAVTLLTIVGAKVFVGIQNKKDKERIAALERENEKLRAAAAQAAPMIPQKN